MSEAGTAVSVAPASTKPQKKRKSRRQPLKGEVFLARRVVNNEAKSEDCGPTTVALKLEPFERPSSDGTKIRKRSVLKIEERVYRSVSARSRGLFVNMHELGSDEEHRLRFLAMDRLGPNLMKLTKLCPKRQLSLGTCCRIGLAMVSSLQEMHEAGFLHRDVKPSNILLVPHAMEQYSTRFCLVDFGLARHYRSADGHHLPQRPKSRGFRGTPRYASYHAHTGVDLSRRDDLWSLLFVLLELHLGKLPWSGTKDQTEIGRLKAGLVKDEHGAGLLKLCPAELRDIVKPMASHLRHLKYAHEPDYLKFAAGMKVMELLEGVADMGACAKEYCTKKKLHAASLFDWEAQPSSVADNTVSQSDLGSPTGSPVCTLRPADGVTDQEAAGVSDPSSLFPPRPPAGPRPSARSTGLGIFRRLRGSPRK